MRVYLIGTPGRYAGANVEAWHTVRVWRQAGIDVAIVPTWNIDPEWRQTVEGAGCSVYDATEEHLLDVPGIRGAITVSFCNKAYVRNIPRLKEAGCKVVWANCMTFTFNEELATFKQHLPDVLIYQSNFQKQELEKAFAAAEVDIKRARAVVVRGAFVKEDFKYAPRVHRRNDNFCIGKIARADLDKWYAKIWHLCDAIQAKVQCRICFIGMGADKRVRQMLGPAPLWSVLLPPNGAHTAALYNTLHCMLPVNGSARENWPRVGLEAMASGVAIVAPNKWGWQEMIKHGETGLLGDNDAELADHVAAIANDEDLRMLLIRNAYAYLDEIADPKQIGETWKQIFEQLYDDRQSNNSGSVDRACQE